MSEIAYFYNKFKLILILRTIRNLGIQLIAFVLLMATACTSTVTPPVMGDNVTDVDGNVYQTVIIGTQTWMIENLKTTHYNDSTAIPLVKDSAVWVNLNSPAYCWYNNDSVSYKEVYGALYNWYTVNTGKLAPKGWHIPTDADWTTLENEVSQYYFQSGSIAKILASTTHWQSSISSSAIGFDFKKNNSSGFSALPGGQRINNAYNFNKVDSIGTWWSSTSKTDSTALTLALQYNLSTVDRNNYMKKSGLSIRCIKDTN